jgi:hypothetical protein
LEETENSTKEKVSKKPDNADQDQSVEKSRFQRLKKYCEKKYAKISHLVSLAHFESSPVLTDNLR